MPQNDSKEQFKTVLFAELAILTALLMFALLFWEVTCGNDSLVACVTGKNISLGSYFFLSIIRPFVVTPVMLFFFMAGHAFGTYWGTLIGAVGALLSSLLVFAIAKAVGKKMVNPWMSNNLPETLRFIRSQDFKVVMACRLIPILPFDLMTFIFGILDFRFRSFVIFTFVGILPEAYLFSQYGDSTSTFFTAGIQTLLVFCTCLLGPVLFIEYLERKNGSSMWVRLKAMGHEIYQEITLNNTIIKRRVHNPNKIPVLLVYGFFSTRRSVTILERILMMKGYDVFSFNMGGLLGIFFTKSITEAAEYIDYKLKRQFDRHQFDQIHIVAHSKGGLVALWWLLKLGGHKHCKKVVTMGTPYGGTWASWLALLTPLGFMWKDVWQMRPGANFLEDLRDSSVPSDIKIYNLYSSKDWVTSGDKGLFRPKISSASVRYVPMHHLAHFDYLKRKEVGEVLARILGAPTV